MVGHLEGSWFAFRWWRQLALRWEAYGHLLASDWPMWTEEDHFDAVRIAQEAGQALLELRRRLWDSGATGRSIASEGDRRAHELIVGRLLESHPADAVLSEEAVDRSDRLTRRRVWVVDPLDGTREFAEGRHDWAVHVALVVDHLPVVGAVAIPDDDLVLATGFPTTLPEPASGRLRVVVSRSRPPKIARRLAEHLGAELVEMGSAGVKAMAVVRGQAEAYIHAGGQYEWDSAAPVAVAQTAGLHASRIDGSALEYNRSDVSLPDLLVCRAELASTMLEVIRQLG